MRLSGRRLAADAAYTPVIIFVALPALAVIAVSGKLAVCRAANLAYSYWNLGNATAIGRNNINASEEKAFYAQEITKKFKLYEEKLREFDEFIVLCDAQRSVVLSTEEDLDEVVSIARQKEGRIDKLNVCILYLDTSGN